MNTSNTPPQDTDMTVIKSSSLMDVQSSADQRGIAIQQVGVKDVEMPVEILQKNGHSQTVLASVTMGVGLPASEKGTHMSRFIIQLAQNAPNRAFGFNLRDFLEETQRRLESDSAHIHMAFRYVIQKEAPISGISAPMAYPVTFEANLDATGTYTFILGLEAAMATLCPCSKAISEYGAHNQRAVIRTRLAVDTEGDHPVLWLEDLIEALDECGSCPVYPVLKREDEKYVTERAYDNPKFVEDVIRDTVALLRKTPSVVGFEVEAEAFESIHGHNAWAHQKEGQIS